jgi:hypothetical protein
MQSVRALWLNSRTRSLFPLALAIVSAFLLSSPSHSRQIPAPDEPSPTVTALAGLVTGAGVQPAGPLAAAINVQLGEEPQVGAWILPEPPVFGGITRRMFGTATAVLNGFLPQAALTELSTLAAGDVKGANCWVLQDSDTVRKIPRILLEMIEDGAEILIGSQEIEAYDKIVALANFTSDEAFRKAATKSQLTYGHLVNHPKDYRGQVVTITGKLKRISRDNPDFGMSTEGVSDLYFGYIFPQEAGAHPYRVIFTEWPKNLPQSLLGQKIDQDIEAKFSGYFYKKYRYKSADPRGNGLREVPMLIGHTLEVAPLEVHPQIDSAWAHTLFYILVGVAFGTVGLVAILTWWFRRSDDQHRDRIRAARRGEFVPPPPDATPVASAVSSRRGRVTIPQRNNLPPGKGDRSGERPDPGGTEGKTSGDPDEAAGA